MDFSNVAAADDQTVADVTISDEAAREPDWPLLQKYIAFRDESAFAEIVRRYATAVYSAATRRLDDRHLAEDATQAVFVILARKGSSIEKTTPVDRWLLKTLQYVAANLNKSARRRRHRERAAPSPSEAAMIDPATEIMQQELIRGLDDALLRLPTLDHRIVRLRYFEQLPIGRIAADVQATEGAVKQRLSRALEKLERLLLQHERIKQTLRLEQIAAFLESQAVTPPPAHLAAGCTAAANVCGVTKVNLIAKGSLKMMTMAKIRAAALIIAVVGGTGAGGLFALHAAMGQSPSAITAPNRSAAEVENAKNLWESGQTTLAHQIPDKLPAAWQPGSIHTFADAPPVVVSTFPPAGDAAVSVDEPFVTVTFSKPMLDRSWSWVKASDDTFPTMAGGPKLSLDRKTCSLPVKLEPGRTYAIWFNSLQFQSFMDTDHRPAVPYLLVFQTAK